MFTRNFVILESKTRAFLSLELNETSVPVPWVCSVCQSYHILTLLRSHKVLVTLLKLFPEICHGIVGILLVFLGGMTSFVELRHHICPYMME
jgi:hypothetical protein